MREGRELSVFVSLLDDLLCLGQNSRHTVGYIIDRCKYSVAEFDT